jgi:hypothetical protein
MMHLSFYALGLSLLVGCAAFSKTATQAPVADANGLVSVAQAFTHDVMAHEQPAITTAVAHLPPETQALAQAAYGALQKGIDAALQKGVMDLSTADQSRAQAALIALGQISDSLHTALHAGGDPMLVPATEVQNSNAVLPGVSVPTIVLP